MTTPRPDFYTGDLYGELYQEDGQSARIAWRSLPPGLLLCGMVALAASWLADAYGFPLILLGLILGLAMSFLAEVEVTAPGLDFAGRHFLRIGIVLLGLQVTFMQVAELGWAIFAGLIAVMASAFAAAMLAARMLGEKRELGLLAGGATAICGASAALALYGVIGRDRLDQARFSITLVGVALASALAVTIAPAFAHTFDFGDRQAGFLIGASVHDAAQAIGGAYGFSDAAGADGTIVKLARVALLGPIVLLVGLYVGAGRDVGGSSFRKVALPWFILGFFIVLAGNSVLDIPAVWRDGALDVSKGLLLLAVTATAIRSRLDLLREAGWRPLMPVAAASVASFAVSALIAIALVQ